MCIRTQRTLAGDVTAQSGDRCCTEGGAELAARGMVSVDAGKRSDIPAGTISTVKQTSVAFL